MLAGYEAMGVPSLWLIDTSAAVRYRYGNGLVQPAENAELCTTDRRTKLPLPPLWRELKDESYE